MCWQRIVPAATLRYILADRQPSSEHRSRIVALLASEARRYLTVVGVPLPDSPVGTLVAFTAAARGRRDCIGCGQPLPPAGRPNRRLCDGCRRFGHPRGDRDERDAPFGLPDARDAP